MSLRVLQMKARNKERLRVKNRSTTFNLNNINSAHLKSSCSNVASMAATPQVSHSIRMNRAKRGLGYVGAKVIDTNSKLTHKNVVNGDIMSSDKRTGELKMRTIAQTMKRHDGEGKTGDKCNNNSNTSNNDGDCTSICSDSNRKNIIVTKDVHTMSSSEYVHALVPKRVDNIICYDSTKNKVYGNSTSSSC